MLRSLEVSDWQETQRHCDKIYTETGHLPTVLASLYDLQLRMGFLDSAIVKELQQYKKIPYNVPYYFYLQYNPSRAQRGISTRPHPSPKFRLAYRDGTPCFCCLDIIHYQWPEERGFSTYISKTALCFLPNPAPIFRTHFTVATIAHQKQTIDIPLLIALAKKCPSFWVIQNDAEAGATNPEHFHMQVFEADLPLSSCKKDALICPDWGIANITIYRCMIDVPVYLFEWSDDSDSEIEKITSVIEAFLLENKDHRVTILARITQTSEYQLYVALRHAQKQTQLYTRGQPGYAEIGGVISALSPEQFSLWETKGTTLYTQLLKDISAPETSQRLFEELLHLA